MLLCSFTSIAPFFFAIDTIIPLFHSSDILFPFYTLLHIPPSPLFISLLPYILSHFATILFFLSSSFLAFLLPPSLPPFLFPLPFPLHPPLALPILPFLFSHPTSSTSLKYFSNFSIFHNDPIDAYLPFPFSIYNFPHLSLRFRLPCLLP